MQKELTYPIDVRTVGSKETAIHFEADPAECAALAERFNVPKVLSLRADLTVRRAGLIVLEGTFSARLIQTCVVSLEDFETTLSAPFKVFFDPALNTKTETVIDIVSGMRKLSPFITVLLTLGRLWPNNSVCIWICFPKKQNSRFYMKIRFRPKRKRKNIPFMF